MVVLSLKTFKAFLTPNVNVVSQPSKEHRCALLHSIDLGQRHFYGEKEKKKKESPPPQESQIAWRIKHSC